MVKKFFSFFNKEFNGINEAALTLGALSLCSQILGLFRDRLLAHSVGAGAELDVYYAAFRVPDFLYVSIASLVSITVLMPFIVEKMSHEQDKRHTKDFLNNIFSGFMFFILFASLLVYIFMPQIAHFIAPGFSLESFSTLVSTSRIMLLSPILIGFSNMIGTITQIQKKFFIFSLSPVFYNLGIIFGIIFFFPEFGTAGLAYGVILGAFLHLLVQVPTVLASGLFPRFVSQINFNDIWNVVKISIPRTLTLSLNSLAFIVLISIASNLDEGSISLFTFSYNLQAVPLGIIGVSYSVAAFPMLNRAYVSKDMLKFKNQVILGIKQILFWALPTTALFIVLRAQIVRVVLGVRSFSWGQTKITAAAVAVFMLALVAQAIILLLVRAYYASGNTRKPLITSLFSSIAVILFGYIFLHVFNSQFDFRIIFENILRVNGTNGTEMLALPLAFITGSIINLVWLWLRFRKDFLYGVKTGISTTFRQVFFATICVGAVAYFMLGVFDDVFNINTFWGILLQGLCAGLVGIVAGVLALYSMDNKEYKNIVNILTHKFNRKIVSVPEQADL